MKRPALEDMAPRRPATTADDEDDDMPAYKRAKPIAKPKLAGSDDDDDTLPPLPPARAGGARRVEMDGLVIDLQDPAEREVEWVPMATVAAELGVETERCFGCEHLRQVPDPAREPELAQLWDFVMKNLNQMHDTAMCNQTHALHEDIIVKPRVQRGIPVMAWPARMVSAHFMIHQVTPSTMLMESQRVARDFLRVIERTMVERDPATKKYKPNEKNALLWLKFNKEMLTMAGINPGKLGA